MRPWTSLTTTACASLLLCGSTMAGGPEIRLEGAGARRDSLDAMQLKPFPTALWGELTEWANLPEGKPVNAESTTGKVVVFVTWSGWYKASHQPVRDAQRLFEKFGSQGLVVVGVHNPRGFEGAADAAKDLGIKFPFAADPNSKFHDGLKIDQDPDFYLIDRAGNLRFADVETASVEPAVEKLIAETVDKAAAVPGEFAADKIRADIDAARTRDVKNVVAPGEAPAVEFELPDPELYKPITWPAMIKYEGFNEWNTAVDKVAKEFPTLTLPDEGWADKLPAVKGKLVIVYVYEPTYRDMLNVLEKMNRVQDLYQRDAIVVSNAIKITSQNSNLDDQQKAKQEQNFQRAVKAIQQKRVLNHPMLVAVSPTSLFDANQKLPIVGNSIDDLAVAYIATTDGVIRWMGHPDRDAFHVAVKKMIDKDPGVQVRRKAEDLKARQRP